MILWFVHGLHAMPECRRVKKNQDLPSASIPTLPKVSSFELISKDRHSICAMGPRDVHYVIRICGYARVHYWEI